DEGEAEDVVNLVGVVGPAGGNEHVTPYSVCLLGGNLRIGVGHGKNYRVGCHATDHLRGKSPFGRKPVENISTSHRFLKRSKGSIDRKPLLVLVHPLGSPLVNDPLGIAHDQVFGLESERDSEVSAGNGRSPGAVDNQTDVADVSAGKKQSIDQTGSGNNSRSVLVVMKDRDLHGLFQLLLDVEAFGSLDILEVYSAESRFQKLAGPDDLVRILGVQLDVEDVDIGKALEQNPFPFHDRLAGQGAEVAEAEHGRAVGDDCHQVTLGSILVGVLGVFLDGEARLGNSG